MKPGNMHIRVRSPKEVRGISRNRITAGMRWRSSCQIVDVLLSYAAEAGAYVAFDNVEVRKVMWNMLSFIRNLALRPELWDKRFITQMDRLLPLEK